jgi:class 3 adenylate cyclase
MVLETLRKARRDFSFDTPQEEQHFLTHSLLSSWRFFSFTTCLLTLVNLFQILDHIPNTDNPSIPQWLTTFLISLPPITCLLPFLVSSIRRLRELFLVRLHTVFITGIAVGAAATGLHMAVIGKPVSLLWPVVAAIYPPVLQAPLKAVVVFLGVYSLSAPVFFVAVATRNKVAMERRRGYEERSWQMDLTVTLFALTAGVVALLLCGWMDLTKRRLYKRRTAAMKSADMFRESKVKSRALLRRVLPYQVAKRVETTGEVAYAEVSDLVGVLVLRFARPFELSASSSLAAVSDRGGQPANSDRFLAAERTLGSDRNAHGGSGVSMVSRARPDDLSRLNDMVVTFDDLMVTACGSGKAALVEKVRVSDGLYIAASNVAVPAGTGGDPGQRFMALARFAVAAVSVVPGARAGLHIGRCASGVLGTSRVTFDIFGDTVNHAAALCEMARGGYVFCSSAARGMLPTRGGIWRAPVAAAKTGPGPEQADVIAFPCRSLDEFALPYADEPVLPHDARPAPIDLSRAGDSLAAVSAAGRSRRNSLTDPGSPAATIPGLISSRSYADDLQSLVAPSQTATAAAAKAVVAAAASATAAAAAAASTAYAQAKLGFHGGGPQGGPGGRPAQARHQPTMLASETVIDVAARQPGLLPTEHFTEHFFKELKTAETVQANPWTLIFAEPRLEETYRSTEQPSGLGQLFAAVGALICVLAFVCELLARDSNGTRWISVVATGVASLCFLVITASMPQQSGRALTQMHSVLVVGSAALSVALLVPTSTWAEFRIPLLVCYMMLLSCARPTLLPYSIASMVALAGALAVFGGVRRSRTHLTLFYDQANPIVTVLMTVLASIALRYVNECDTRRLFLLMQHSVEVNSKVEAELAVVLKVLRSCLPSSVLAGFLDREREATTAPPPARPEGSPLVAAVVTDGGGVGDASIVTPIARADRALDMKPVYLPEWTVLAVTLFDLPRLVARLDHGDLVLLLRHFFLLVENTAAAEECEVIRAHGGLVLVSPKIEGAAAAGVTPADRAFRLYRASRTIVDSVGALSALLPLSLTAEGSAKPPALKAVAGIATGQCIGAMIGKVKSSFDIVGPVASAAIYLAQHAIAGTVAHSEATGQLFTARTSINNEREGLITRF